MEIIPHIFMAKTMHKRFFPRVNQFVYKVYYLALPLSKLKQLPNDMVFAVNRPALFSFYEKDHGARNGSDLQQWATQLFAQHGITHAGSDIVLVAMPRILGFVFNPVSFWMCYDDKHQLRAVIAEVNNTFGETHSYLCRPEDGGVMDGDAWLWSEKLFHVSPFLERKGSYAFRFKTKPDSLAIWIDYFLEEGRKQLATSLIGDLLPFNSRLLLKAFIEIPFVTLKTIALIHWQALVLALKHIRYIDKPPQLDKRSSVAVNHLTKK